MALNSPTPNLIIVFVKTSQCIQSSLYLRSEQYTNTVPFNTGITISGVRCVQLVAAQDRLSGGRTELIKKYSPVANPVKLGVVFNEVLRRDTVRDGNRKMMP